jgi:hypothetical protein
MVDLDRPFRVVVTSTERVAGTTSTCSSRITSRASGVVHGMTDSAGIPSTNQYARVHCTTWDVLSSSGTPREIATLHWPSTRTPQIVAAPARIDNSPISISLHGPRMYRRCFAELASNSAERNKIRHFAAAPLRAPSSRRAADATC